MFQVVAALVLLLLHQTEARSASPDKQVILYDNGLGGDNAVAYSTQYPDLPSMCMNPTQILLKSLKASGDSASLDVYAAAGLTNCAFAVDGTYANYEWQQQADNSKIGTISCVDAANKERLTGPCVMLKSTGSTFKCDASCSEEHCPMQFQGVPWVKCNFPETIDPYPY